MVEPESKQQKIIFAQEEMVGRPSISADTVMLDDIFASGLCTSMGGLMSTTTVSLSNVSAALFEHLVIDL